MGPQDDVDVVPWKGPVLTARNLTPGADVEVKVVRKRWEWPGAEEAETVEEWKPAKFVRWRSLFFGSIHVEFPSGVVQPVRRGWWRIP